MRRAAAVVVTITIALAPTIVAPPARADSPDGSKRPLLVTVDDLPFSARALHASPEERRAIASGLLAALEKHRIPAVGLVTWGNVQDPTDRDVLEMWLAAGHELGNHSMRHLSYTATDVDRYIADVESCRTRLSALLAPRGRDVRFFRFPFLREGNTAEKVAAMRAYLAESGQRNLPVTLDNQDWSFERPWVEARRGEHAAELERIACDYQAALRVEILDQERRGDRIAGRPLPQILLLHANEVGSAQWNALFTWLTETGHRFATADEVLGDSIFAEIPAIAATYGFGAWDRIAATERERAASADVALLLAEQSAAWNRGDLDAFCAAYAADAVFVSPSGLTRGRDAVLARYHAKYPDRAAMGNLTLEVVETRPVSGIEVSLLGDARPSGVHGVSVVARWSLAYPDRAGTNGLTLLVLARDAEGWRIVQDASM